MTRTLRWYNVAGYAAGDSANNLVFMLGSLFLLHYYTEVAGIPPAVVGTLFLVERIWAGITDFIAGWLVDRVRSRWGRFRPYLLAISLPLVVVNVLVFSVPDTGLTGKVVWAYVTYGVLGFLYSLINIPYSSLATVMSQSPRDRARLGAARSIGAAVTIVFLTLVVTTLMNGSDDPALAYTVYTALFGAVALALYGVCHRTSFEAVETAVKRVPIRESVRVVLRNRALWILCVMAFFVLAGQFGVMSMGLYYSTYVLGSAGVFVVLQVLLSGLNVAMATFIPALVARWGKKPLFGVGGCVLVAGLLAVFLVPTGSVLVFFVGWVLAGLGLAIVSVLLFAFELDTVEYGEWVTGVRAEGLTYAAFSFVRKVGQAVGSALSAYTLAITGYVANAPTQTPAAEWGIRAGMGLIPAVAIGCAFLVMLTYPITEKKFAEIVAGIGARRESAPSRGGEELSGT